LLRIQRRIEADQQRLSHKRGGCAQIAGRAQERGREFLFAGLFAQREVDEFLAFGGVDFAGFRG
jgi:hypothetical protein